MPTLTPLVRLSQETEGLLKIVAIDPGKRVNPIVGLREAKQHGHPAPFPEDQCGCVLSASAVTAGFLETTHEEFEVIIGTRQQRWLQVLKQMGSPRDRALLQLGHYTAQFCRQTAGVKLLKNGQELRLRFVTAWLDMSELGDRGNPAEEPHALLVFLWE